MCLKKKSFSVIHLKLNYCWSMCILREQLNFSYIFAQYVRRTFLRVCCAHICVANERHYTLCTRDAYTFRELMPSVIRDTNNVTLVTTRTIFSKSANTYARDAFFFSESLIVAFLLLLSFSVKHHGASFYQQVLFARDVFFCLNHWSLHLYFLLFSVTRCFFFSRNVHAFSVKKNFRIFSTHFLRSISRV